MKRPVFNIGDKVYHITPDSTCGVILNIRYLCVEDTFEYLAAFAHDDSKWCYEHELQTNKSFV